MLHVDGSSIASKDRAIIFLQRPNNIELEVVLKLNFDVTNNEALIDRMKLTQQMKAKKLITFTDSQLVTIQVEGCNQAKEKAMIDYLNKVK